MKQVCVFKPGEAVIINVPMRELHAREVKIRVKAAGICGTDLHILSGSYCADYPVVPGHEFAGIVEEVGRDADMFQPGDRVAVEPNIACGHCALCRIGRKNFCKEWTALGVTLPGGFAEMVIAPEDNVFPINDLTFEQGLFMEPLSCVVHGITKFAIAPGMQAFVAGAGTIGNLIIQVLKAYGIHTVIGEPSPARREIARKNGALRVYDTSRSFAPVHNEFPEKFDLVIDATGIPAVMEELIHLARPGGEVLLFGVPPQESSIALDAFHLFKSGLTIRTSYTSVENSEEAIQLMEAGKVDTTLLVSHRFSLEDFKRAMACAADAANSGAMKVVLTP